MNCKRIICKISIMSLLLVFVINPPVYPAAITFKQPISFGTIIASPSGETIEIDARNGPAAPVVFTSNHSIVFGGTSGIIRVFSDIPGQMISIVYPASVTLSAAGASDMILDGMNDRSKIFATSTAVGEIDFDVGGLLHINGGQISHSYSTTITITVDIINP